MRCITCGEPVDADQELVVVIKGPDFSVAQHGRCTRGARRRSAPAAIELGRTAPLAKR
jgi:hypothetical protein